MAACKVLAEDMFPGLFCVKLLIFVSFQKEIWYDFKKSEYSNQIFGAVLFAYTHKW